MHKKYLPFIFNLLAIGLFALMLSACNQQTPSTGHESGPTYWVQKAIGAHGGEGYNQLDVSFDFRNIHYTGVRDHGHFRYTRQFEKDGNTILDELSNEGFSRHINDSLAKVPDSMATKYSASVNSVWYFALLPKGLDNPAVLLKDLGNSEINGSPYQKIEVRFKEEGGGEDFEDVFIYWIHHQQFTVDYLAYSYNEDDGLGIRFRVAQNARKIGGIRWQDYLNYKADPNQWELTQLDQGFVDGKLELLSEINLENIEVKIPD